MLPEWRPVKPKGEPVRKLAKPRIGPRMRELQAIVSACPGITKAEALRAADLPDRGMGAHRPVNRAVEAGLIMVEHERPNLCHLFASERDRQLWHLRRGLMSRPTPARAAEIAGEVARLRQAQAAAFADACE